MGYSKDADFVSKEGRTVCQIELPHDRECSFEGTRDPDDWTFAKDTGEGISSLGERLTYTTSESLAVVRLHEMGFYYVVILHNQYMHDFGGRKMCQKCPNSR